MTGRPTRGNPTFVRFRTDVVTKPDGRYLIYYSWPDDESGGESPAHHPDRRQQPTGQSPWSPETGPTDV